MERVVKYLIDNHKTIATMESCTGGALASHITNVSGSSEIFKYSAVTYSNEFKIKMGVSEEIIDTYTVYSIEVAKDMSKKIADFAHANYGIGITGNFNKENPYRNNIIDNTVYFSIYDSDNGTYYPVIMEVSKKDRVSNKEEVINEVVTKLKEIFNLE